MKRLVISIVSVAAIFVVHPLSAQTEAGGLLADRDIVTPADIFELSQTTFTFGTARSMAMAGAFTSLGADLSSMSINPAGLGMYRRSEFSITPLMSFERSKNNAQSYLSNKKDRFSIGNFGISFNVYEGTGGVSAVSIGFGYNRLQDLNYRYSFLSTGNTSSVADLFSGLLQSGNYDKGELAGNNWKEIDPYIWGSKLGIDAGMTDQVGGQWRPTWIGNNVDIGHYTSVESSGSVGEYAISMGLNTNNKFYFGATVGIQSISQRKTYRYWEDYYYDEDGYGTDPSLDYQLRESSFDQQVSLSGVGVNLKLGAIWRPTTGLRIGLAVHTPTSYLVERQYRVSVYTLSQMNNPANPKGIKGVDSDGTFVLGDLSDVLADTNGRQWRFSSPARLLFGVSYAFGSRGVVSVDYERDWYNGMRIQHNPAGGGKGLYNDTFRTWFRGANILRVGAEFKPHPMVALRAGFGYMDSGLKHGDLIYSSPMLKQMFYFSGGVGFAFSPDISLDIAYSYSKSDYTRYQLFYYVSPEWTSESGVFHTKMNRHSAAITLGIRW